MNNHSILKTPPSKLSLFCLFLTMLVLFSGCRAAPPTEAEALVKGQALSAGLSHTCAVTTTGKVKCWGSKELGKLGDGDMGQDSGYYSSPVYVSGLNEGVIDVSAGGYNTCARLDTGGVKCWGDNSSGQVGSGSDVELNNIQTTPVDVSGLTSGVVDISVGVEHVCALTTTGGVKCWGSNSLGQLGIGNQGDRNRPADLYGLTSGVVELSVGYHHSCARLEAGNVKCWGRNSRYQIGDGTTDNRSIAVDVIGLSSGVDKISAGGGHTCVLMDSSGVKCWGANENGEVGDGSSKPRATAVDVTGLSSGVVAISAGGAHTCALMDTGGVKCWGDNSKGQLGDGSLNDNPTPVDVFGLSSGVDAISAGGAHTCALMDTGILKCWGDNSSGQLGNQSIIDSPTPVDVFGFTS